LRKPAIIAGGSSDGTKSGSVVLGEVVKPLSLAVTNRSHVNLADLWLRLVQIRMADALSYALPKLSGA